MTYDEIMTKYEPVIGIETHVQLATKSKLFCGCNNNAIDAEPNTLVCPVCLGLPGTLPVLNEGAVKLAIRAGLALNGEIAERTKFDRKNYFYPDLPKGYQITQFDRPIVGHGSVEVAVGDKTIKVGITRAHLEEDAGKLIHPAGADYSLVDLNRAGTPLLEIVSEPDMHSPAEARAYAQEINLIIRYAAVSAASLYHGNMRFDVNVSLRLRGEKAFGTRSETKNLNSFRSVERAVEYEIIRQAELREKGERIVQETRGFNEDTGKTVSQRSKEEADEYRYFPEPDLPPLVVTKQMIETQQSGLDAIVLPAALRQTLKTTGLPDKESEVLVADPAAARIWQNIAFSDKESARFALNWLIGDAIKIAEETNKDLSDSGISETSIIMVSHMAADGRLSSTNAKLLMRSLWNEGIGLGKNKPDAQQGAQWVERIASELGLIQQSDEGELAKVVAEVVAANPQAVADLKSGNERAIGALVGAAMKATQGRGNPELLTQLIRRQLSGDAA